MGEDAVLQLCKNILGGTVCVFCHLGVKPQVCCRQLEIGPWQWRLDPDVLRLCANETRICHQYSLETCVLMFPLEFLTSSWSERQELTWEAPTPWSCLLQIAFPTQVMGGQITVLTRNCAAFSGLNSFLGCIDAMALAVVLAYTKGKLCQSVC